jgi:hypothetical protein
MSDKTFDYKGLGISRQCYRKIAHEVWMETWHTSLKATIWGIAMILIVVAGVCRSSGTRVWMFGINSEQRVEIPPAPEVRK